MMPQIWKVSPVVASTKLKRFDVPPFLISGRQHPPAAITRPVLPHTCLRTCHENLPKNVPSIQSYKTEYSPCGIVASNDRDRWVMTDDAVQGLVAQIVFSRKYPNYEKYMDKFEEGLTIIRENGNYLRVFEKYYGKGKVPAMVGDIGKEVYVLPKQ